MERLVRATKFPPGAKTTPREIFMEVLSCSRSAAEGRDSATKQVCFIYLFIYLFILLRPCVLTFTKIFATPKIMPPSTAHRARGCPFITNVDGEDFVVDGITKYGN